MKKRIRNKSEIIKDEALKRYLLKLGSIENIGDIIEYNYIGKTVKLNTDSYNKRIKNKELSERFVKWYNENIEKEFTVEKKSTVAIHYELVGIQPWVFSPFDLLSKCDECGEYIDRNLHICKYCGKSYITEPDSKE